MRRWLLAPPGAWVMGTAFCLGATGWAQVTRRVSLDSSGAQGNGHCIYALTSADGRFVAFTTNATNHVPGDTNGKRDIFVRDRHSEEVERVSVDSGGTQANGDSYCRSISPDARYVAFHSNATNLVPGDTNGLNDAFVRDVQSGATERVSVSSGGAQADGASVEPWISADGRYVTFRSEATNLVPGDTNGTQDVFVRDRQSGTTERVSVDSGGAQGNGNSHPYSISADGRFVAFQSNSTNLVPGGTGGFFDVFVRDRQIGTTELVSLATGGTEGNSDSYVPSISANGRYVTFVSDATNLVPGDTNGIGDVFVRDRQSGATERVSVGSARAQGDGDSYLPSISFDERYVVFQSNATNLVGGDTNDRTDVFVRDLQAGTTERVSLDSGGAQGNLDSFSPSISADGRFVTFMSSANNLVPDDTNGWTDAFVRDRLASGFTSLCDPGVDGVIPCPCSSPPSDPGRGCDNSSATGGAMLSASGVGYLSSDSLVFTTSGERPAALSIVLQGDALLPNGLVYGQSVRCVGGQLERLFVKSAVDGSITAPEFGAGDPTVSDRSAARGDPILAGQSRWYLVYYRDPIVLGGCPASSTFNATQTGQVTWWP